jgi:hypothetical protein
MDRKKKRTGFVPRLMVSGLAGAVPACVAVAGVGAGCGGSVSVANMAFDGGADGYHDAHQSEPITISLAVASFDAAADTIQVISLAVASFDAAADALDAAHIIIALGVAAFDAAADTMDGASDGASDGSGDGG